MNILFNLLRAYWKPLISVLILASIYGYIHHLRASRDDAVQALADYKTQINNAQVKALAESTIKQAASQSKYDVADYISKNNINAITTNSHKTIAQISKSIKGTYEAKSTESHMVSGTGIMLKPASDSDNTKEAASDTERTASSESVANGTCITIRSEKEDLELACAATTAYFNQCRSLLDADTVLYGREDN